jgi:general secretion pathway protein A
MYENFFGFKEKPFKLVPNPAYLFLSKSHEEALAHLNYALSQGDGFVEITGEVGTGKTTLCRAFLESLNDRVEAAYIFNPKLGPKQLLEAINDEFNLPSDTTGPYTSTKDYIDKLNRFLIQKKAEDKKVILLIDEAQNLKRNVLEQLRLLSNLETNKDKLLQIVLIGQPELAELLNSQELRQIGQRITLSYQLAPLSYGETRDYIQYRLNVASHRVPVPFTRLAFRHIYRYAKGVPRLINIACDRTLLAAFGLNRTKITGRIAKAAIKELRSRGIGKSRGHSLKLKAAIALAALSTFLILGAFFHPALVPRLSAILRPIGYKVEPVRTQISAPPPTELQTQTVAPEDEAGLEDTGGDPSSSQLISHLGPDTRTSRYTALRQAMQLWQTTLDIYPSLNDISDDQDFFRLAVKRSGFLIYRMDNANIDLLQRVNLPAILEFVADGNETPRYMTLGKINGEKILFAGTREGEWVETTREEVQRLWSGVAFIPWKNYLSIWGTIPSQSFRDSVISLKLLLKEIGFSNLQLNEDYDELTQHAVEAIQAKYGIPVDGFVGPLTKIILYREKKGYDMPRLIAN